MLRPQFDESEYTNFPKLRDRTGGDGCAPFPRYIHIGRSWLEDPSPTIKSRKENSNLDDINELAEAIDGLRLTQDTNHKAISIFWEAGMSERERRNGEPRPHAIALRDSSNSK